MQAEPLFLKNPDWYVTPEGDDLFFEDGRGYHLAPGAPKEAVDSYNEFYNPTIVDEAGVRGDAGGWSVTA